MRRIGLSLAVLLSVIAVEAPAGHWCCHCPRSRRVCCLPAYDYRGDNRLTSPARDVTFKATALLRESGDAATGIKTFAMKGSSLAKDQCSISRVGITLEKETGRWTINFTALQDPSTVPAQQRPIAEVFKRNRFYVTIRVYGAYEAAGEADQRNLGQPQLMEFEVPPFWLDRGQEENVFHSAWSSDVTQYFDLASRIEVDLQYE